MKYPKFKAAAKVIENETYAGWCVACGAWTADSTEPDAAKDVCPKCGKNAVYGAEELMIQGMVK
jgi:Zn finger protein HypA/HybF involved in hydrogenase expression